MYSKTALALIFAATVAAQQTTTAVATVVATSSASSIPVGSTLSDGGYVCNPAHSYPAGETCIDGPTPTLSTIQTTAPATAMTTEAQSSAYVPGQSWSNVSLKGSSTSSPPVATYTGGAVAQYAQPALLVLQPLLLALF